MKKFFAVMAVITMAVLTGCENLKIGDEEMESGKMYFTQKSAGNVTSVIEDNIWKYKDNDNNIEFQVRLESGVEGYANDTTFTKEASLSTVSYVKDGEEVILGWEKGEMLYYNGDDEISSVKVRKHLQDYLHTLDKNVSGKTQEFHYEAEVKTKSGKTIMSPARNPKMEVVGNPKVVETASDEIANYFKFAMTYSFVIDNKAQPELVCHKTLAVEGDTVVAKTDEGFEWLTFYGNGNPKTGKSWIEVTTTKNGHSTSDRKEVTLNFWQNGEPRDAQEGANFNGVKEIGSGIGEEVDGDSFDYPVDEKITVTPSTITCNSGVLFSGTNYNKVLVFGRERAVWSDGENSFNMPSPAYEGVYKEFDLSSSYKDGEYECKLNTITMHGSIYGKDVNVKAETELRVKSETFTLTVVDSAFVYINPTTSDTRITIRETGNKGTVREYERDVHVYNGIESPASVTYDVTEFDSKASQAKLDDSDVYVGSRESGEFTIYKYKMGYTTGSESVSRYFRPYYERAYHNPTGTWMMWRKYENISDNGFVPTDLSDETVSDVTYLRKKYVYSMSAVYNGHNDSATGEAILRVKVQEDNNRQTPSWLGDPQWAEYTRVQKTEGAQFEDMVVYGYAEGVVLAPKGVADLTNGVFAYDQSVADAHGVERCARNSAFTGVWKASANKWIPAKCETQNAGKSNETWIYTGRGVSHSVMANNAVALGIGKDVTWNPKETVTISDGTISVKYSKNNASLSGNDLVSLK